MSSDLTWISPQGTAYPLTSDTGLISYGLLAVEGVKGLGAAQRTITADAHRNGGTRIRRIQPQPRIITLPVYVEGTTQAQFRQRWQALADAFGATRWYGPGRLRITHDDGTSRETEAYYQDGFDPEHGGTYQDTAVVQLYCPDAFFRATSPTLITRSSLPTGSSFFEPFPQVTSSQTLGTSSVTDTGGVEAWPVWTLNGPADVLTATNVTTGEAFELDVTGFRGTPLLAGESVVIDSAIPTIHGPSGANYTGALNWPSAILWSLLPGTADVSFVVSGSGSETSVEASFYARYEIA